MTKLSDLNLIHRPDMRNHQNMKTQRPSPIGIAASGVYQYEGTELFQWYTTGPSPYWRPYGEPILIDGDNQQSEQPREFGAILASMCSEITMKE